MAGAVGVFLTQDELTEVRERVRTSNIERSRKRALKEPKRAEQQLAGDSGARGVVVRFGEKPRTGCDGSPGERFCGVAERVEKASTSSAQEQTRDRRANSRCTVGAERWVGIAKTGGSKRVGDSKAVHRKHRR